MVADERASAALLDQLGAGVGIGALADDVPQAPDLVDAGVLRVGEHGLERGKVRMDVGEDRQAHDGGHAKADYRTAR